MRLVGALALLLFTVAVTACHEAPPDVATKARVSLAMGKMEAGQAKSDIARANARAGAEIDSGQGHAIGAAPDAKALDH